MTQHILDEITTLDITRWERARKLAHQTVREMTPKPDKSMYTQRAFGRFPLWVTAIMLVVLFVIGAAAFWISAGKQIAATDIVLEPVVRDYSRLSNQWADIGIVLNLLLGELGTVLFFTAAGIFPGTTYTIRGLKVQLVAVAFRLAGIMCASFAILANITITALHPMSEVAVYAWFLTLAPPLTVLFIGIFAERLLLVSLEARAAARDAYNKAYDFYENIQRDPESHPKFKRIWHMQILDQLMKVSPVNRKKIEAQPELRGELIRREFIRHEWAEFTIEEPPSRPTKPSQEGQAPQLPLPTLTHSPNGFHKQSEEA